MSLETLAPDTSPDAVLAALERDGACIVRDLLPRERLARIDAETAPWIERTPEGFDAFSGRHTKRTGALVARCPSTRGIVTDPLALAVANGFLLTHCQRIQLHLTQTIAILPGEAAQALHRDREAWAGYIPREIEPQLNTLWALTDFTAENGATHVIPGSHRWETGRKPRREESLQAEMERGSVLVYSGSVVHGGGANQSDAPRIGMNITYTLAWLRQEENQFLSCPPKVARDLEPELTDLLGYTMGSYALGYYSSPEADSDYTGPLPPEAAVGRLPQEIPSTEGFPGSGGVTPDPALLETDAERR